MRLRVLISVMIARLLLLIQLAISVPVKESEWFNSRDAYLASPRNDGGLFELLQRGMSSVFLKPNPHFTEDAAVFAILKSANTLIAPAARLLYATINDSAVIITALTSSTDTETKNAFTRFWTAWQEFLAIQRDVRKSCDLSGDELSTDFEAIDKKSTQSMLAVKEKFTWLNQSNLASVLEGLNVHTLKPVDTAYPKSNDSISTDKCDKTVGATVSVKDTKGLDGFKLFATSCIVLNDKVFILLLPQNKGDTEAFACPGPLAFDMDDVSVVSPPPSDAGIKKPDHTLALVIVCVVSVLLVGAAVYIWFGSRFLHSPLEVAAV